MSSPFKVKRRPLWLAAAILMPITAMAVFFATRPEAEIPHADAGNPLVPRNHTIEVGGVKRPLSDVSAKSFLNVYDTRDPKDLDAKDLEPPYGSTPLFQPDSTPATAAAMVALDEGDAARITPLIPPAKFDLVSFEANPDAYLDVVEPGRVWQTAQPGRDVPTLARVSRPFVQMKQRESVRLQVRSKPKSPVTFTSFDLGIFQNKLPSITVRADEEGTASASFTAPPGTFNQVNILAASPQAAGNVRFIINVDVDQP